MTSRRFLDVKFLAKDSNGKDLTFNSWNANSHTDRSEDVAADYQHVEEVGQPVLLENVTASTNVYTGESEQQLHLNYSPISNMLEVPDGMVILHNGRLLLSLVKSVSCEEGQPTCPLCMTTPVAGQACEGECFRPSDVPLIPATPTFKVVLVIKRHPGERTFVVGEACFAKCKEAFEDQVYVGGHYDDKLTALHDAALTRARLPLESDERHQ